MAVKDGCERTLSVRISQWDQPEVFPRHFQDPKYVGEKKYVLQGSVEWLSY